MAVIREQLVLENQFSETFNSYIRMGAQAAGASEKASMAAQNYESVLRRLDQKLIASNAQFDAYLQEQEAMQAAGKENTAAFGELDAKMEKLGGTIRELTAQYKSVEQQADKAADAARAFAAEETGAADAAARASSQTDNLTRKLSGLVGAHVSLRGLKGVLGLSDELRATTARLDRMNDGLQTTEALQNRIMASAQRTRGSYQDTADLVARLGTLAGNAFSSSQEIVDFAEQINKQLVLSGASAAGAQAAMLQLTQAMSSGILRGEELNSILEQAPTIAQAIADYMGVTVGTMRDLASEGKITADVVKNAMFAAADETNEKFSQMPMTWSQVWTQAQNILLQAFQPMLDIVGQLASLIGENMDTAIAVFYGLAAAVAVYTAAQWIATGAAQTFFATLMSNPILLAVAVAIGVVVALIYKFIKASGGLHTAWLRVCDALLFAWDSVKYGFMVGVYWVCDLWDTLSLKVSSVANAIAGFFGDMKASVLLILEGMVNGAIDLINGLIEAVNLIPGVAIDPIQHVTFGANAAIENEAAKAARQSAWEAQRQEVERNKLAREQDLQQMLTDRNSEHAARQEEIARRMAEANAIDTSQPEIPPVEPYGDSIDSIESNTERTAGSARGIEKALSAVGEDIKSLVDLAERRYVNNINLSAPAPIINVHGANTGNTEADRRSMADAIRDILLEQTAAGAVRSTARVF